MNEEKQENWALGEGTLDNGLPYTIRFREDLPEEKEIKRLRMLIVVSWFFESVDGTGLPDDETLNLMEDFENLIDEALVEKGTARLMTVFTGEGIREWQLYTDDAEFFMEKFNEAMEGGPALPLEIEAQEDEDWDAYRNYIGNGVDD